METELRLEGAKDHRIVEELTREAFWNIHYPGADEHLLIHRLRKTEEFVPGLDFVAIAGNEIAGNIVYAKAKITGSGTEHTVLTFGPVSVLPSHQNRGIGSKLIRHTIELSKGMGYRAILIYGDPEYYKRFGFRESKAFNITNTESKFPAALLALELYPGALAGISGAFSEGKAYRIDEKELEEFEKGFAKKEKQKTKIQERFIELSNKYL